MSDDENLIVGTICFFMVVLGGLVAIGGAEMAGLISRAQLNTLLGVGGIITGGAVALLGLLALSALAQEVAADE